MIYRLYCNNCDKEYIGSTLYSLDKRFKWHNNNVKGGSKSKLHNHMRNCCMKIELIEKVENLSDIKKIEDDYILKHNTIENGLNTNRAYIANKRERLNYYVRNYRRKYRDKYNKYIKNYRLSIPKDRFKCEHCSYSSNRSDSLKNHISRMHISKQLSE